MENTKAALHKHNRTSTWFFLVIIPMVIAWIEFKPIHQVETLVNPVMTDGSWGEEIATVPNGVIVVGSTAIKQRKCDWEETIFYVGARDSDVSARMNEAAHLDKPKGRELGPQYWEEIFLPITKQAFETQGAYADSIHTCGDRLVRSKLFTHLPEQSK